MCTESREDMRGTVIVLVMTAPPLLLQFNPAESCQSCDEVLPYFIAAKHSDKGPKMYSIPSCMAVSKS